MPRQLDRERAAGVELAVRWAITRSGRTGADVYDLAVAGGRARVTRGGRRARPPPVTITVDGVEFLRLVTRATRPDARLHERRARRDRGHHGRGTDGFAVPGAGRRAGPQTERKHGRRFASGILIGDPPGAAGFPRLRIDRARLRSRLGPLPEPPHVSRIASRLAVRGP